MLGSRQAAVSGTLSVSRYFELETAARNLGDSDHVNWSGHQVNPKNRLANILKLLVTKYNNIRVYKISELS